jgi:hypothetical protein
MGHKEESSEPFRRPPGVQRVSLSLHRMFQPYHGMYAGTLNQTPMIGKSGWKNTQTAGRTFACK